MHITIIPVGIYGTNCYLLASDKKSCAIIDPGSGAEKISGIINEKGYAPKYILLTHGHYDHTGAVKSLREKYPDAELRIGAGDIELLEDPEKSRAILHGLDENEYLIPGATGLSDGDVLEMDELRIGVLETSGHTLGGVCYICADVIFSGDTLFLENVGRCDLYGGNFESLKKSLSKLAELEGDYTVYPGHGGSTSLEHERARNPYLRA